MPSFMLGSGFQAPDQEQSCPQPVANNEGDSLNKGKSSVSISVYLRPIT
jgi:hypothetical protein